MSESANAASAPKSNTSEDAPNGMDTSVLQRPINVGVRNIQQVLRCIQNGTAEVRDLIFNECTIIYECKVCANLFRSLANFLAHKRFYCTEHCCEYVNNFRHTEESEAVVLQPEKLESQREIDEQVAHTGTKDPAPTPRENDIGCLNSPNIIVPLCPENECQSESKVDIPNPTNNFEVKPLNEVKRAVKEVVIQLEEIQGNPNAVFQQVQTVDNKQHNSPEAKDQSKSNSQDVNTEGPNIRIIIPNHGTLSLANPPAIQNKEIPSSPAVMTRKKRLECRKDCDVGTLGCLKCQTTYTSIKTLYLHMMTIHAQKRLFYPCLYCSASFVQVWGVIRHIVTAHQKSKEQATKLREVIRRRAYIKKINSGSSKGNASASPTNIQSPPIKKLSQFATHKLKSHIPGNKNVSESESSNTVHPCGKCGRAFSRKSSRISHEKFCKAGVGVNKAPPKTTSPTLPMQSSHSPEKCLPSPSVSTRPKRFTEKKVPKDFVNSQNLKWKSANKVEMNFPKKSEKTSNPSEKEKKLLPRNCESEAIATKKALSMVDKQKLICLKCHRKFFSIANLFRHVAIHVGWMRFKCGHCSYQSYSRSECRTHIQNSHQDVETTLTNIDKHIISLPSLGNAVDKEDEMMQVPKKKASASSGSKQIGPLKTKGNVKCSRTRCSPERRKKVSSDRVSVKDSLSHSLSCTPFIITASKSSTTTTIHPHVAPKHAVGSVESGMLYAGGQGHYIPTRHSARAADNTTLTTLVTRSGTYPKAMLFPLNLYTSERNRMKKNVSDNGCKVKCEPA